MFTNCKKLKGAIEYVDSKTKHKYANYNDGYFTPKGGFTYYAELNEGTGTLTFRRGASKPAGAYDLNVGQSYPKLYFHRENIKTVVFDASLANARPTSLLLLVL